MLYRDTLSALVRVGLEPSLGYLHRPRSASFPLACDLMEIFRVPMVDTAFLAAVNRKTFDYTRDFEVSAKQVWLTDEGRKRAIEVYERRKDETYQHPVLKYSLSFRRLLELEARLLEKEWAGEAGLFARMRLR